MRLLSGIIVLGVVSLGIAFALVNSEWVTLHYYVGSTRTPLSVLVVGVFIAGLLIGWLFSAVTVMKLKWECRRLQRKLANPC